MAVIDGNSLYSRAFFASVSDRNSDKCDELTDISLSLLVPILDPTSDRVGQRFDRLLWCWDTQQKRDKKRAPKPPGFEDGLALFKAAVARVVGGGQSEVPGFEADDQVATAVYRLRETPGTSVYVVSSDKDLHQLVGRNVRFYCLSQKAVLSMHSILSRWHVKRPPQIAIAQAVLGDPGDNISGIKGWGDKKVQKLFEAVTQEMELEEALEVIMRQIPAGDKMAAFLDSLELTFLNSGVPGVPEPEPLSFSRMSSDEAADLGVVKSLGALARLRAAYEGGGTTEGDWLHED